jgi:glycosyltransferase involved in cell wall biosynthesis
MRILFINQCYRPDHASTAQHLTDLAEGLASRGHDVTVLCSRNPYVGGGAVFPRHECHQGVLIHRVATLGYGKKSGIKGRMLDYLSFHFMALLKGLRLPSPDAVVTLTSPLLVGVLGWLLAGLKRTKHVHWCMDLFPDTGVLFGIVRENGLAHRLCAFFTRRYLRSARGIVAISPYMMERIKRYGVAQDRIHVVPVWAVGKNLGPIPRHVNGFRREHQLQDKFVVMFSGNLELGGDMDTLIGALAELREDRDIRFVLISEGPRVKKFREMSARAALPNVVFLPYQDRDMLAYSLSAGDVHIVTNKKGLGGLRVPGKTYGILAVGRPILYIGEPCCEVADLVRDHRLGFVIQEHDVQNLVSAIRKLRDDPVLRQEISVRARALFEADYQAESNIGLWEKILTSTVVPEAHSAESKVPVDVGTMPRGFAHGE